MSGWIILWASVCWAFIGPTTQKPPLARSCRANIGPTTVDQLLMLALFWTMLYLCQHANIEALPIAPTIHQRWLND